MNDFHIIMIHKTVHFAFLVCWNYPNSCNLPCSNVKYFYVQSLVWKWWTPYVKYGLGPGDETILEICCQLVQRQTLWTNTNLRTDNKWGLANQMGNHNLFWAQDESWEEPTGVPFLRFVCSPNTLLIVAHLMFKFHIPVLTKIKSYYPEKQRTLK